MKQRRPIGITILAFVGVLYGICFLLISITYIILKPLFVFLARSSPYTVYTVSFICLLIASCFFIASFGLFKKKVWARTLFLLAVCSNMTVEIWLFVRDIMRNAKLEASLISLGSVLELSFALILLLFCFWYFKQKNAW